MRRLPFPWRRLRGVPPVWAARLVVARFVWPFLYLAAVLYRRTVLRRSPVVAVIGSFGKTTTRAAVAAALGMDPDVSEGNIGSAVALAVLRGSARQPVVVEVGITGPGQMTTHARLLRPTIVVVTSIGSEHWLSLGDRAATAAEKGAMIAALPPHGVVFVNGDDEWVRAMGERRPPGRRCVTFGYGSGNEVRAEEVALDWPEGTNFRLVGPGFRLAARVGMVGAPAVRAALAAAAVARELGVEPEAIVDRLRCLRPRRGRLQTVRLASGAVVVRDDSKAPLEAVETAIDFLATVPARRRVLVLGGVSEPKGPQSRLYQRLGEQAGKAVTRLLLYGGNYRDVAKGARRAGLAAEAVTHHRGVHEIAQVLAADLRSGDVVLLKGRTEERLGRVALILAGGDVRCRLSTCYANGLPCERCPRL